MSTVHPSATAVPPPADTGEEGAVTAEYAIATIAAVGFAALLALLGGVAIAARTAWRADPALAAGPSAALVVWLVHSGIDWDWEMPALTLVAVVLAGLLLGRAVPLQRSPA